MSNTVKDHEHNEKPAQIARISTVAGKETYEKDCRVYFVEADGLGLVKIGYALDVRKRFIALMTASPVRLTLLGTLPGGAKLEAAIHAQLADHRAHGEWFHKSAEVLAVVGTAQPAEGQEWLNQAAKVRGAALQEYLGKLKRGEVVRPGRGPTKQRKVRPSRYEWSPEDPFAAAPKP